MAAVARAQQMCAVKANLGVIAALAAVGVADADEAAFESELKAQGRAIDEGVAESGATSWCLAALRRFGPHGVDMPGGHCQLTISPDPKGVAAACPASMTRRFRREAAGLFLAFSSLVPKPSNSPICRLAA